MKQWFWTWIILPLVVFEQWEKVTADHHQNMLIVTGCDSRCNVNRFEDVNCFNRTRHYFERTLLGQLRAYVLSQADLATWKIAHDQRLNWSSSSEHSAKRMFQASKTRTIQDLQLYQLVTNVLSNDAQILLKKTVEQKGAFLSAECPYACEKSTDPYRHLFFGSSIATVLLTSLLAVMSVWRSQSVERLVKKEALEAYRNHELTNTIRRKQSFRLVEVNI